MIGGSLLQKFFHPAESKPGFHVSPRWGQLVFAMGMVMYLGFQSYLVLTPVLDRSAPVEVDDSYIHILKAAQMQKCFFQDCPALEDLRPQLLTSSSDPEIAWIRYREYVRAFLVYSPLHSVILLGVHSIGLSWEAAYNMVEISGALFIGLSIGFWLYVLWGPGAAGVALGLLALTIFYNQGFHYIVPTNLALGIAMLSWSLVIQLGRAVKWGLLGGILLMVSMHPMGRLYAVVTVGVYLLLADRPLSRRTYLVSGVGLLIVGLAFCLPWFVSRPELNFWPDPYPAGWDIWRVLRLHIGTALHDVVGKWINFHGGYLSAGFLILVGFLSSSPLRRKNVLVVGGLLSALLPVSLLFVLPRYPAASFARVWIGLAVLLSGAIGHAIFFWFTTLFGWLRRAIHDKPTCSSGCSCWIPSGRGLTIVLLVAMGVVLGRNGFYYIIQGSQQVKMIKTKKTTSHPVVLDQSQPGILLSSPRGCKSILYASEVPMHFFFSQGALQCGAVYYPALAGTPEEKYWVVDNEQIKHFVSWNPIHNLPIAREGALSLVPGDRLVFRSQLVRPLTSVFFYLENLGEDAAMTIRLPDSTKLGDHKAIQLRLPAKWAGWLQATTNYEIIVAEFSFEVLGTNVLINLRGLQVSRDASTRWPWNQGITLVYIPAETKTGSETIRLEFTEPCPLLECSLRILADGGSTILAEIVR
jgi:hypothetical protein